MQKRLYDAIEEYEENGEAENLLFHDDPRLDQLHAISQNQNHWLNQSEMAFIAKSVALKAKKRKRFLRNAIIIATGLIGLSIASVFFGISSNKNANEARIQRDSAQLNLNLAIQNEQLAIANEKRADLERDTAVAERIRADSNAVLAQSRQKEAEENLLQFKKSFSNYLVAESNRALSNENTVQAFRLAQVALRTYPDNRNASSYLDELMDYLSDYSLEKISDVSLNFNPYRPQAFFSFGAENDLMLDFRNNYLAVTDTPHKFRGNREWERIYSYHSPQLKISVRNNKENNAVLLVKGVVQDSSILKGDNRLYPIEEFSMLDAQIGVKFQPKDFFSTNHKKDKIGFLSWVETNGGSRDQFNLNVYDLKKKKWHVFENIQVKDTIKWFFFGEEQLAYFDSYMVLHVFNFETEQKIMDRESAAFFNNHQIYPGDLIQQQSHSSFNFSRKANSFIKDKLAMVFSKDHNFLISGGIFGMDFRNIKTKESQSFRKIFSSECNFKIDKTGSRIAYLDEVSNDKLTLVVKDLRLDKVLFSIQPYTRNFEFSDNGKALWLLNNKSEEYELWAIDSREKIISLPQAALINKHYLKNKSELLLVSKGDPPTTDSRQRKFIRINLADSQKEEHAVEIAYRSDYHLLGDQSLVFSDGSSGKDKVFFWDLSDDTKIELPNALSNAKRKYRHQGHYLAYLNDKNSIVLFNLSKQKPIRQVKHQNPIKRLSFWNDGSILLSYSDDQLLKITTVKSGFDYYSFYDRHLAPLKQEERDRFGF